MISKTQRMKFFVSTSILFFLLLLTSCSTISNQKYAHLEKVKRNPSIVQINLIVNDDARKSCFSECLQDIESTNETTITHQKSEIFHKNSALSVGKKAELKLQKKLIIKQKASATDSLHCVDDSRNNYAFRGLILSKTKKNIGTLFIVLAILLTILALVLASSPPFAMALMLILFAALLMIVGVILIKEKPSAAYIFGWSALVVVLALAFAMFVTLIQALSEYDGMNI
jgi:hypothetical protein